MIFLQNDFFALVNPNLLIFNSIITVVKIISRLKVNRDESSIHGIHLRISRWAFLVGCGIVSLPFN